MISNTFILRFLTSKTFLSIAICLLKETLHHSINENNAHVSNEADIDEMDMNKDGH